MSLQLTLDTRLADRYTSRSQRARVLSEHWAAENLYCPACESDRLFSFPNNQRAADLGCPVCRQQFELKSAARLGPKIVDGAYATLIKRLNAADNPNLILLRFSMAHMAVLSVDVVPKQFFVPSMVEPRRALATTARRAGWIGCNIRLDQIPKAGRIPIIVDGTARSATEVRTDWAKCSFLGGQRSLSQRSWIMAVMRIIDRFGAADFALADVYQHEDELRILFPSNRNIRAKLRQQLQRLRDEEVIHFLGHGRYRAAERSRSQPSDGLDPDGGETRGEGGQEVGEG